MTMMKRPGESLAVRSANKVIDKGTSWLIIVAGIVLGVIGLVGLLSRKGGS